ncbi:MAG: oligogalacturonate lyase family protein [Phycisphaerae bacterium]
MGLGQTFAPERRDYRDPQTGARITQLTNWRGHSNHFYFTTTSFVAGQQQIVFVSDRNNQTNLFLLDLQTGRIRQLTQARHQIAPTQSCLNPRRREVYYFDGKSLCATDLDSLQRRELYRLSDDRRPGILTPSADGTLLAFAEIKEIGWHTGPQYQGFADFFRARPPTNIRVVQTDGARNWVALELGCWVSHVNFSPKHRDVICYCHEGPWDLVEQRMWICTIDGSKNYPLRPQDEHDAVGHEYWLADGEHVAFHNFRYRSTRGREGAEHRFGWIRWDNSDHHEFVFAAGSTHFQSNSDNSLVVGDGYAATNPYILLWQVQADRGRQRRLARHDCSFHIQRAHCHPIFSPDDRYVLYTSDHTGYCNLYLAEVGSEQREPAQA